MRYLQEPEPLEASGAMFGIREFLRHMIISGQQFNANFEMLRVQARVHDALDRTPLVLEEGDWEKVAVVAQNPVPMNGYTPYPLCPAHRCIRFIDALLAATTEPVSQTKAESQSK